MQLTQGFLNFICFDLDVLTEVQCIFVIVLHLECLARLIQAALNFVRFVLRVYRVCQFCCRRFARWLVRKSVCFCCPVIVFYAVLAGCYWAIARVFVGGELFISNSKHYDI